MEQKNTTAQIGLMLGLADLMGEGALHREEIK
jgi:hypothetical protein